MNDTVGFHADTVADLKRAFHEAVDDFVATCAAVGKKPERPYSGRDRAGADARGVDANSRECPTMTEITDREITAALSRGAGLAASQPRAAVTRFDPASGRVIIDLTNGCGFAFPARALQAEVEVIGAGFGLHWGTLDADFTLAGLLMGLFGTRAWMDREKARRAGAATSPAKAAAARANGRKGGRPRNGTMVEG